MVIQGFIFGEGCFLFVFEVYSIYQYYYSRGIQVVFMKDVFDFVFEK